MQFNSKPNSVLFVRVSKKAIQRDTVIRVAAQCFPEFTNTKAMYVSDVSDQTTLAQLQFYCEELCRRFNFAEFRFVKDPTKFVAKEATV